MRGNCDVPVSIRSATSNDIDRLSQLYAAFFSEDAIVFEAENLSANLAIMLGDERACIFVVETDGIIAGLASATLTFGVEFGWAAELEDLYIVPGCRGRGLANMLAGTVLDWADDQGATEVVLVITPEAEAEQALTGFYKKLGFRDSQRTTMYREVRRPGIVRD